MSISLKTTTQLKNTCIQCISYLNFRKDKNLPRRYFYADLTEDEWYDSLGDCADEDSDRYYKLVCNVEGPGYFNCSEKEYAQGSWATVDKISQCDYDEIQCGVEELLAFTISLLDKYSSNQDGDLNLRFILMQYRTLEIINSLETSKQEVYFKHFLNSNIFGSVGLLGILAGNERLEYLEHYKQANWLELIEFIKKLYNKYQTRIVVLIPINIDNLPIKSDGDRGSDKVCRLDPTDPAYNYSLGLKQYLIIFDLMVIRLKHNYESNKTSSFSLSNLVLILSSKTLIEALNLTTSQLSQLEGFLLNLEFDGEQLDNGIIFDNERWQFIYHWIDQMRTWLVKNG